MTLSLCMIVKNESAHLARCLESVKGLADDIVVVDTGSTDGTREIAAKAGARVFDFTWVDDFAKARNHALDQVRAPWVLALDGDEQLLEVDREKIRTLLQGVDSLPPRAYNLLQRNSSDGGRSGMLVRTLRLFPNRTGVRYEGAVHEQVVQSLLRCGIEIVDTEIEILHDGYGEASVNTAKQQRNLAILQKEIEGGLATSRTYFLKGGAQMDLGEFEGAISAYRHCLRSLSGGDEFAAASRVRIAGCLFKLGRFAEACSWTAPTGGASNVHPEQLLVRGKSLKALGDVHGAMAVLRGVLSKGEAAFMPPCNLSSAKIEAVLVIAAILKEQGKEAVAVDVMRGALERHNTQQPLDEIWLAGFLR